jgi:tetratricopeptide (TPR) repeat protein
MRRIGLLTILFLLAGVAGFGDSGAAYYGLSDFLSRNFADPNAGLTAFPTLLIPMGGRYEGMGTAYTAVALDSGYIEANPSASSVLERGELSFLHHSWIADSNLEGVIYTMRYNDLGIGLGGKFLYVPFTEYNDWGEREARGYFSESVATLNLSYNFFSSYAFYGLAVGANLKAAYRNVPAAIYPDQSVLTGLMDFGMLTRFNLFKFYNSRTKNFSVGLALKNLGLPALSEPVPTMATFGIAYSPIRPLTWALDFNLPISFDPQNTPAERWYLATGFNVAVTDFLALQSGFMLKADNPRVSVGAEVDLRTVSFVLNYNLDLSGRLNPLDKFSIEAKLNLGDRGRLAERTKVDELYLSGLEAYAQGNLQKAIELWEQALILDPGFQPARDNITTARKALDLQNRVFEETQGESR